MLSLRVNVVLDTSAWGYDFKSGDIAEKKPGYFQNDSGMATKAFRNLGMREKQAGVFSRHPLAYLNRSCG